MAQTKSGSPAPRLSAETPLFPQILARHARNGGHRDALITAAGRLSWHALVHRIHQVANGFAALGLKPKDTIAVVMGNGEAMVETLLGAMAGGYATAPLNLSVTDEALAAMMQDADVSAIVATADQQARIDAIRPALAGSPHCILAETRGDSAVPAGWLAYEAWRDAHPGDDPGVAIQPDWPLNVIYSSGTTGLPKGIVHTHQTRLDWAYDLAIALRYHTACRTLCTLGLYSNIAWVMLLCTLLTGGALVVSRQFDAAATLEDFGRHRITHTAMVPVQWQRLLDQPGFGPDSLSGLHAVMSCGSSLPAALKQTLLAHLPHGIIELYGLTEGLITTLDPEDAADRLASVGRPLPGVDLAILDEDGRRLPAGQTGEIAGTCRFVMPGYLNRPDATREASWTAEDGSTWLRTGDIGRFDADGFLYLVDRKKDMIISGGQNIYPADIERVLLDHPDVTSAAVIGIPDATWGETPLAVVEAPDAGSLDTDAVRDWVNARVGKRQRIRGVVRIDTLPRNANGKILKRELRRQFAPATA